MSYDYSARLTAVRATIDALLTGGMQSYDLDGQSVTLLDLDKLRAEEERLEVKVSRANRRGGAFRRVVVR